MKCLSTKWLRSNALFVASMFLVTTSVWAESVSTVPREALKYRSQLTREARAVWGLNAPVPVMAAQIHQESRYDPTAKSKYAGGIAQFTPATAEWISGVYRLGEPQPFDPAWAIRALVLYDRHLWDRSRGVDNCHHWGFTLAGYNGGAGWIAKERKLAGQSGVHPDVWFDGVERFSARAEWAWKENRDYPRKILFKHQQLYRTWGETACLTTS